MTTTVLVVLGFRVTITIVAIHLATAVISHLVSDYSKVTAISPEVFSFLDFTISSDLMLVAFDWVLTVVSYHLRDYYHSAVEFRFSLLSLAFTIDLMFVTVVMSSAPDFLDPSTQFQRTINRCRLEVVHMQGAGDTAKRWQRVHFTAF